MLKIILTIFLLFVVMWFCLDVYSNSNSTARFKFAGLILKSLLILVVVLSVLSLFVILF